eukprot:458139-Prymnesium_polylepis.1
MAPESRRFRSELAHSLFTPSFSRPHNAGWELEGAHPDTRVVSRRSIQLLDVGPAAACAHQGGAARPFSCGAAACWPTS